MGRRRVRARAQVLGLATVVAVGLVSVAPVAPVAAVAAAPCQPGTPSSSPAGGVVVGDTLYFGAVDGVHGRELWTSDGTAAGTVLVDDIRPGRADSGLGEWVAMDGAAYFRAHNDAYTGELWRSDGTRYGTVPLVRATVTDLEVVGHTLFFITVVGLDKYQLWRSDGTRAGTDLITVISTKIAIQGSEFLGAVGDTVLFTTDDGDHGYELWRSDGTEAGTALVADLSPGSADTQFTGASTSGGLLYFLALDSEHGEALWASDGTTDGTRLVKDINPGLTLMGPSPIRVVDGRMFFVANDGTHGRELWSSDGTEAGTGLVRDINSATTGDGDDYLDASGPADLSKVAGELYFSADDGVHGRELWRSDGTEAGTALVDDVFPGDVGSDPAEISGLGGEVLFAAAGDDEPDGGRQLWATDGTAEGTRLLVDVDQDGSPFSGPRQLHTVGDRLFFTADDGVHGAELWGSDGTAAGTAMVADINDHPLATILRRSGRTVDGQLSVGVRSNAPAQLRVRPLGGSELQPWSGCLDARPDSLLLTPTRAGERELARTGSLRVKARFVFRQGGPTTTRVVRSFTLRER